MMRWNPLCRLAPTLILLLPAVTFAYTIETPETMEDVLRVFNDEIPAELGAMQCGGWVPGVSVGEEPGEEGFITKVEGVPGRASEPLGDILSGLGVRKEEGGNDQFNDGYEYPQDALGLTSNMDGYSRSGKFIF
jgi:hypothetical protein